MCLLRAKTAFRDNTRSWLHRRPRKFEEHGGQLSRTASSTLFGIRGVITTIQSRHCSISWLTGWSSYDFSRSTQPAHPQLVSEYQLRIPPRPGHRPEYGQRYWGAGMSGRLGEVILY